MKNYRDLEIYKMAKGLANDEAINQLEMLNVIYFQGNPIDDLIKRYNILGAKLNRFIKYVESSWKYSHETRNTKHETRNPQLT